MGERRGDVGVCQADMRGRKKCLGNEEGEVVWNETMWQDKRRDGLARSQYTYEGKHCSRVRDDPK